MILADGVRRIRWNAWPGSWTVDPKILCLARKGGECGPQVQKSWHSFLRSFVLSCFGLPPSACALYLPPPTSSCSCAAGGLTPTPGTGNLHHLCRRTGEWARSEEGTPKPRRLQDAVRRSRIERRRPGSTDLREDLQRLCLGECFTGSRLRIGRKGVVQARGWTGRHGAWAREGGTLRMSYAAPHQAPGRIRNPLRDLCPGAVCETGT